MNREEKNKNVTFLRHKIAGLLKYQYFCYLSYLGIFKKIITLKEFLVIILRNFDYTIPHQLHTFVNQSRIS